MLQSFRARSFSRIEKRAFDVESELAMEQQSAGEPSSSASFDRFYAEVLGEGCLPASPCHTMRDGEGSSATASVDSSPFLGCPLGSERSQLGKLLTLPKIINSRDMLLWQETEETEAQDSTCETDMMKERFAKLLLGEDLSGGGKGVCSALAISNAITNLSASLFGELWRLEPFAQDRKARWWREMGWLLSVSDYIVEFVPSSQMLADGSTIEVMVTRPRTDLHINLPALQKLNSMLFEALDSFTHTEFWYVDRTVALSEDGTTVPHRQEEKWWLPTPRVPVEGLSIDARKQLQHQRGAINQIMKAALAINAHMLSEIDIPTVYWEALPKNGRSSLGEGLYRSISTESFSPEAIITSIDPTHEHSILELVNRVEAAIHIWRKKLKTKQTQLFGKDKKGSLTSSWGLSKDGQVDMERREVLAGKAESLLLLLRQRFPGLPQTILDMSKIQHNKDVGQAILESYSRVLESLAFNILSRIDDILHADDLMKNSKFVSNSSKNRGFSVRLSTLSNSGPVSGNAAELSGVSKLTNIHAIGTLSGSFKSKTLSEFISWSIKEDASVRKVDQLDKIAPKWLGSNKQWLYSDSINAMHSPPSRD